MTNASVNEDRQPRPRSRWLKRDATLLVFGIGGSLTGFVQLIPLIAPRAPHSFLQGLSVGVLVLTVVLMGVAFCGGRWAQARHVEMLRIRMIKKRRWLLRWESRYRGASETVGLLLAFPEERRESVQRLNAALFRRARLHRRLLVVFGSHFDYEWLRFQRARNDYFHETGRKLLPILETSGIVKLNTFNVEIGRQKGLQKYVLSKLDDSSGLMNVSKAAVELQESLRDDDAFSSFLKKVDQDVRFDDGTDPATTFYEGIVELLNSEEFRQKMKD